MINTMNKLNLANGCIEMVHGSGGRAMQRLIEELFLAAFDNPILRELSDQASFDLPAGRVVMATDSHVISPLFFNGGDIGSLSIHGTINDVVMSGAQPYYLSAGFILEEGFALSKLKKIVDSMAAAARDAGVPIVTGDTKVVEKGKGDGVFINTTGVGVVTSDIELSAKKIRPGCSVLLSGSIGDHGVAILSQRENLSFETTLCSDSQPLHRLVRAMIEQVPDIVAMRDPTRGGLATTLNEMAAQSGTGIIIDEKAIPIKAPVKAACEFLGLDPLYVANEGKLVAFCPPEKAERLLEVMQSQPEGKEAAIIGEVGEDRNHFVQMKTLFGGHRMVDWLTGEQLPRIC